MRKINWKMNLANKVVQKDIDKANQNLEFQTLDEQTDTKMKSVLCRRLLKIINLQ